MARKRKEDGDPLKYAAPFREYAGVLTAFLVVIAFVLIGFGQMGAEVVLGVKIAAPADWSAAMLSLASAALGFLIGKNIESSNTGMVYQDPYSSTPNPVSAGCAPDSPCPICGFPLSEHEHPEAPH